MSEIVALYDPGDPAGRVVGAAPRDVVRRDNLPHAASCTFVRRSSREVFVHRRAETKDLWPGRHDASAGGVVLAGEDPDTAAVRELGEELGIVGPTPAPLLRHWFRDESSWYLAFVYTVEWDGAVTFADGEVSAGWWSSPDDLYRRLADPTWPFVPDGRELLELPTVRALLLS